MFFISRNLFQTSLALSLTSTRFKSISTLKTNSNSSPVGLIFFSSLTIGTFGLGVWQSFRYNWKLRVLEQRAKHLAADPIDVTSGNGADLLKEFDGCASSTLGEGEGVSSESKASSSSKSNSSLNELQQVKVRGRFVEGKIAFIGPRPPPQELPSSLSTSASNSGVLIIRPFERDGSNGQVLILEGWSPHDKLGEIYTANHNISSSNNEVKELSGVIRRGEKINSYMSPSSSSLSSSSQSTRTVDLSNNSISEAARFTFLNVNGIARALGLRSSVNNGQESINSKDEAVIIELFRDDDSLSNNSSNKKKNLNETIKHTTPLSFPIPRTLSSLRDGVHVPPSTHLIYAGTWFTLSLCGVALTAARFRGGRRSFRRT